MHPDPGLQSTPLNADLTLVAPVVAGLPDDDEEDDFECPKDGLSADPNSDCRAFFKCQGEQVNIISIASIHYHENERLVIVHLGRHAPSIFIKLSIVQSWRFNCSPTLKFDATDVVCKYEGDVDDNCNVNK